MTTTRPVRAALVAASAVLALLAASLAAPGPPAAAGPAGALTVTPERHYPGQLLTWTGNLGVPGRQQVRLQKHLNRAGDTWEEVPGSGAWTAEDGSFSFTFPAPAMRGISYRVVGDGVATDDHLFWADHQEVTLEPRSPVAGKRFRVVVDTAAASPIVLPGRAVSLQRRLGDGWETVATGAADDEGRAVLRTRVRQPGTVVYRARAEDWTDNGDQVGWFPSFPTYVDVASATARNADRAVVPEVPPTPAASRVPTIPVSASPTASGTYGWHGKLYDFAWAYGESLTSPPYGGSQRARGWWEDRSDGTARAYVRNGGLEIATSPGGRGGPGDLGSASATLHDQPRTTGRWEIRHRSDTYERASGRYRVLVELVPDSAAHDGCEAQTITIAELDPLGSTARIGARSGARSWTRSVAGVAQGMSRSRNYAVEVTERRITWFFDGEVVGTLRDPAALPREPMTVRLSLVGEGSPEAGQPEMNATRLLFDWVRGWDLGGGRKPPRGPRLQEGTYDGAC